MNTPKIRVGFIGLGIMGQPMAGHLLGAGYPLSVYNRTTSKAEDLASKGARLKASPAEVAADSEVIITMVSDSPDVKEVIAGSEGVVKAIKPDSVVVDMSTISPGVERELDQLLQTQGCHLVDAPVSGGDVGARNASLAIMAGGDRAVFERVEPLLGVMGQPTYCGAVGCGQLTKLCNQILVVATLLGVSEALAFAKKNHLDSRVMVEATRGGAAGSWQLSNLA
ncbi:MAG: NAD(P)-dependent oxidoreductase, partial [Acidobacteriota bacterium]